MPNQKFIAGRLYKLVDKRGFELEDSLNIEISKDLEPFNYVFLAEVRKPGSYDYKLVSPLNKDQDISKGNFLYDSEVRFFEELPDTEALKGISNLKRIDRFGIDLSSAMDKVIVKLAQSTAVTADLNRAEYADFVGTLVKAEVRAFQ